jgi:hypothetical protein
MPGCSVRSDIEEVLQTLKKGEGSAVVIWNIGMENYIFLLQQSFCY